MPPLSSVSPAPLPFILVALGAAVYHTEDFFVHSAPPTESPLFIAMSLLCGARHLANHYYWTLDNTCPLLLRVMEILKHQPLHTF